MIRDLGDYVTIQDKELDRQEFDKYTRIQQYIASIVHIKGTLLPDLNAVREYYKLNNLSIEGIDKQIVNLEVHLKELEKKKEELEE